MVIASTIQQIVLARVTKEHKSATKKELLRIIHCPLEKKLPRLTSGLESVKHIPTRHIAIEWQA